jgi:DNA-binding transcriptional LysR family regulator
MSVDNADIRLLRLFMQIVEAGGFSAAQNELNLTLSTISGKVAALEERLGVDLCTRGRAGFALTDSGRTVYEEARRLFAAVDRFNIKVTSVRSEFGGLLSIGLVDNIISDPTFDLSDVIARFSEAAPAVSLHLTTKPPSELLRDVLNGQIQLAIGSFPMMTLGLTYYDLYKERQQFYCGARHPLFAVPDTQIDRASVQGHKIIGRRYWGTRDLKLFAVASPDATVSDMEAEAHLILSGAYLGYLPEHYAAPFVRDGRLRALRPDFFSYEAPFQIVFDENKGATPALSLFLKIVRDELAGKGLSAPA